jgi:response regulator NasT
MAPSIEAALARFAEVEALLKNRENLHDGIEKNRVISTAVGVIMERAGLSPDVAFEHLRQLARAQRKPLRDVARELVDAVATINSLTRK